MSVATECRWKNCYQKFGDIVEMLAHIHNDHIEIKLEDVNRMLAEREKKNLQLQVQQLGMFFKSLQLASPQLFQCIPGPVQHRINTIISNNHQNGNAQFAPNIVAANNNPIPAPPISPRQAPQPPPQQYQPQPQVQHQSPPQRPPQPQHQPQPQSSTNVQQQPATRSRATVQPPSFGRPSFPAPSSTPTAIPPRFVFGKLENLEIDSNPVRVNITARPSRPEFFEREMKVLPKNRRLGFCTPVGLKFHCNWDHCKEVSNSRTRANLHYRRDHLKQRLGKHGFYEQHSELDCIELD